MHDIESLIGNADVFPILRHWEFFQHAGLSPLPNVSIAAMRKFLDHIQDNAYLNNTWHRDLDELRHTAAKMLNCDADEIAFVKNTGEGLSHAALGIDWKPGDRIVTTAVEYPSNMYPWMEACLRYGTELVRVEEEEINGRRQVLAEKIIAAAEHPRTRMVTLSHVEFASGQRHDLVRIGEFCSSRGILLCIDAIQSMGVMPIDVRAMHIDYLSADGHKWMLGPEAAGIFFCRRERIAHTRPASIGYLNVVNPGNFHEYNYILRPDARRFECGSLNVPGLLGLKASLDLFQSVGVPTIARRIKTLTDFLISLLEKRGCTIASPRDGDQWSAIVSFTVPDADHAHLAEHLRKEHRTELAVRAGRMRCSPHFYNTEEQMERLVARLG